MTYKVIRRTKTGREVAFLGEEPLLVLSREEAETAAAQLASEETEGATYEVVEETGTEQELPEEN